jgi:hypothetical protein
VVAKYHKIALAFRIGIAQAKGAQAKVAPAKVAPAKTDRSLRPLPCHCEARSDEAIPCLTSRGTLVRQEIASALRASQ